LISCVPDHDGTIALSLLEKLVRLDERILPRLARGLRRVRELPRPRALVAITALLVLVVVVTVAWDTDAPVGRGIGDIVRVGPQDGDSIPGYLQASRDELDRLVASSSSPGGSVYALVTLAVYASPERVAGLFRSHTGVSTLLAYARVPLPRRQTARVQLAADRLPSDLTATMTRVAGQKTDDASGYTRLAQSESAPDRRRLYESLASLATAEARAYQQACACVFAVVVRAMPGALAALATHPDVRGVDPAPEVTQLDRAVFAAPLPEQTDRVQPPADEDAPQPGVVAPPPGR
jgi:hypothetical protein